MIKAIIIDDEQHCVDALKADLAKYCSNVEVCAAVTSAKEGILAIKKLKPRLVFLDVEMPWMNGFELLEMLSILISVSSSPRLMINLLQKLFASVLLIIY